MINELDKDAVIYLGQPYSKDPENAFKLACNYVNHLRKKGFVVFSPILHTHPYHLVVKDAFEDYVQWDLDLISKMTKVNLLFLSGWEDSFGCKREIAYAKSHNLKIVYVDEERVP